MKQVAVMKSSTIDTTSNIMMIINHHQSSLSNQSSPSSLTCSSSSKTGASRMKPSFMLRLVIAARVIVLTQYLETKYWSGWWSIGLWSDSPIVPVSLKYLPGMASGLLHLQEFYLERLNFLFVQATEFKWIIIISISYQHYARPAAWAAHWRDSPGFLSTGPDQVQG